MPLYQSLSGMEIVSPFMASINDCRSKMKKLRKKIYKNLKAKQHSTPTGKSGSSQASLSSMLREAKIP
jgi:hypothetical protein